MGGIATGQRAAAIALHPKLAQERRTGAKLRVDLQHYSVLVELSEDSGNLPLAEGVIERVVNGLHRHPQPTGLIAVDVQLQGIARCGEVVIHVRQFRPLPHRLGEALCRGGQRLAIEIGEHVLVFGRRDPGIQGKVLHRLQ
ncbi:dna repair protein, partial [Lasius niger]